MPVEVSQCGVQTPADLIDFKLESLARGVVDETVAEFAVADDESGLFQQRELGADGVVREAAGAEQNLNALCPRQFAEHPARGAEVSHEAVRAMRDGAAREGFADFQMHIDGAGQIAGEDLFHRARGRREGLGHLEKFLEREIHGLELRLAAADERAERHEAEMLVEPGLARGAGDDGHVVAHVLEVLREQADELREDEAVAEIFLDREQADFEHLVAGRQVGIEVRDFVIEREGPVPPPCHHADEAVAVKADGVGVFRVKLVHEALLRVVRVLGDFLDEGFVVEAVDGLELPVFARNLELQRRLRLHHWILCGWELEIPLQDEAR